MALAELVVVRVVAQPSFDIELITLVDILLHDLGKLPVEQEVMPVGMIGDLRPILRRIGPRSVVASVTFATAWSAS